MIWLRKGVVFLLSVILLISLVVGVAAFNINRNLGSPSALEQRLAGSGIYSSVTNAALEQSEKSSSSSGDSGTVSLSDTAVQQAANSAFSQALVEREVNAFIEGNYHWLSGKKSAPDYNIDLTSAKESFAKQVGQAVQTHLSGLPACTPQQLNQLPIPVDPLQITCRPITLDPKAEGDRVAQEINDTNDFLGNPVITANTLNQPSQNSNSGQENTPPGKPYYKQFSWAPTAYRVGLKLPWIFGALALLSGVGIIFLSLTRRRGVRRIGVVLLLVGLVLIGLKFAADSLVNRFAAVAIKSPTLATLKQPINDFLHKLEPQLVSGYLIVGILFVVLALAVFVWLFRTRNQAAKPKKPVTTLPPAPVGESRPEPAPLAESQPAPRHQPAPPPPVAGPSPTPKPPSSLGKNPPRRKPPKLVQ